MKIKQVCEETGLTKKTIRFYESEGLFLSEITYQNGKAFHNYTEDNIETLRIIATLRRARFTVDEIRRMLIRPSDTPEIFLHYRQRLADEKRDLDQLYQVAVSIDAATLSGSDALVSQMETVTAALPLPTVDIHPRFRYLDALEESYSSRKKKRNFTEAEQPQHNIAAINAALYAGFSVQNSPGNNMAAGGKGGSFDCGNAQKIAAYNLLRNFDED